MEPRELMMNPQCGVDQCQSDRLSLIAAQGCLVLVLALCAECADMENISTGVQCIITKVH